MNISQKIARMAGILVIAGLCVTPEMMLAATQQSTQPVAPPSQNNAQPDNLNVQSAPGNPQEGQVQQQSKPQGRGTTVDPSQAPLQPVTTYPEAPTPQQDQPAQATTQSQQTEPAQQPRKPVTEPVGAAAAAKVATTGGAASRPAGAAIAPAKQHQTRSLLIKFGALAAAGIAAGTVYGLSRNTSSMPPNSTAAGVTRK